MLTTTDFRKGVQAGASIVPTFGMMFFGYGLVAAVTPIPELAALAFTLLLFASPAQFAMADVAAQGGGIVQLVSLAIIVNLRFFVMSMTLAGSFKEEWRPSYLFWCQFVAVTTCLTTFLHWRRGRIDDAFSFYKGVVAASVPAAVVGTAVGVWFGSAMPAMLAFAATLFLPVYFSLMLSGEKQSRNEFTAVVLGFLLTPLAEVVLPGWGLFVVALTVGLGLYWGSTDD